MLEHGWKKKETLIDAINVALGAWLALSPWIVGFSSAAEATWNAWLTGIVIAALAVGTLAEFAPWEEWINIVVGLWAAIAPWVVGFSTNVAATRIHVITGLVVAALAAVRLWFARQGPPHVTA